MNCLNEILCGKRYIIGIKDYVDCDKPESGLFINQVPGINLKAASKIAPDQAQSGALFLQECIKTATQMVFDEFLDELTKYFNFNNIVETRDLQNFSADVKVMANVKRGIVLKRWRSELAQIYVERIYVKVKQTGPAVIEITDGAEVTTINADLTAEVINIIDVRKKFNKESISILMNDQNFDTYNCNMSDWNSCGSCASSTGKHFLVRGWNGAAEESGSCYGIGVMAYIRCFEENVICSILPRMYWLILYKSAIVFLKEFIATDRVNFLATFGKEMAATVLEDCEEEYKKKWKTLLLITYQFLKDTKGECIQCNGNAIRNELP